MDPKLTKEVLSLPVGDRLELMEELWESIVSEPDALPLTDAQRTELDRRLATYEADPDAAAPWEEVRARLWDR
jgi:putative addiction module component (TIGR02574 family)